MLELLDFIAVTALVVAATFIITAVIVLFVNFLTTLIE